MQKFDELFKRTISDDSAEEDDFIPEYEKLLKSMKLNLLKDQKSPDWTNIYIKMQTEV